MKSYNLQTLISSLAVGLLMSGCTATTAPATISSYLPVKTITATGYGTVEKTDKFSQPQIKLMAMRASKMDAYRSLAEQLNGIQLRGQTNVEDMEATHDSYQVYLNAYLRGARVKRTSAIGSDIYAGDDTFETVVELDLTPRFYECMNGPSELINQCLQPPMPPQNTEKSHPASMPTSTNSTAPTPATASTAKTPEPTTVSSLNKSYPSIKGYKRKSTRW